MASTSRLIIFGCMGQSPVAWWEVGAQRATYQRGVPSVWSRWSRRLPLCVLLLAVSSGMLAPQAGWSQDAEMSKRLGSNPPVQKGMFLIADPMLEDPNFVETVVLLWDHGAEGSLGVIINRPTGNQLSSVIPKLPELENVEDPLYFGGPVLTRVPTILYRLSTPPADGKHVFDNVYVSGSVNGLEKVLPRLGPTDAFKVFAGHSGWAPGQLDFEMMQGAWRVLPADGTVIFDQDPKSIWQTLLEATQTIQVRFPSSILQDFFFDPIPASLDN